MTDKPTPRWLDEVQWNKDGLITAIAQDADSGEVLSLAWMNCEALQQTVTTGFAVYWSRSRQRLWKKGEESGHTQKVLSVYLDCDRDAVLLSVQQTGGIACHTGRRSCFYFKLKNDAWVENSPVIKSPDQIYK